MLSMVLVPFAVSLPGWGGRPARRAGHLARRTRFGQARSPEAGRPPYPGKGIANPNCTITLSIPALTLPSQPNKFILCRWRN